MVSPAASSTCVLVESCLKQMDTFASLDCKVSPLNSPGMNFQHISMILWFSWINYQFIFYLDFRMTSMILKEDWFSFLLLLTEQSPCSFSLFKRNKETFSKLLWKWTTKWLKRLSSSTSTLSQWPPVCAFSRLASCSLLLNLETSELNLFMAFSKNWNDVICHPCFTWVLLWL